MVESQFLAIWGNLSYHVGKLEYQLNVISVCLGPCGARLELSLIHGTSSIQFWNKKEITFISAMGKRYYVSTGTEIVPVG